MGVQNKDKWELTDKTREGPVWTSEDDVSYWKIIIKVDFFLWGIKINSTVNWTWRTFETIVLSSIFWKKKSVLINEKKHRIDRLCAGPRLVKIIEQENIFSSGHLFEPFLYFYDFIIKNMTASPARCHNLVNSSLQDCWDNLLRNTWDTGIRETREENKHIYLVPNRLYFQFTMFFDFTYFWRAFQYKGLAL